MLPIKNRTIKSTQILDGIFIAGGIILLLVFTTVYLMPFRLDDVLHMDWAREHRLLDAFDVSKGEIVRSVRPVFAITIWILTHTAGVDHYFPWHIVLVSSFLIGLAYAGKTARYISRQDTALYFTTGLFWFAFLPILNVLFWYGDLTFTIELLFVGPAWYYGLRGLLEGKTGLWGIGIFCGILAVLTKEPAIVLVHTVFAGAAILHFSKIKKAFSTSSAISKSVAVLLYAAFFAISLKLYFASPTKSNRFFDIGTVPHDQLMFFINDRLRYYSQILLNPLARICLVMPLLYSIVVGILPKNNSAIKTFFAIIFSSVISFLFVQSLIVFGIIIIATIALNIFLGREKQKQLLVVPFAISAFVIMAVLMITIMLVKTQLAELSFVLLIISGSYWASLAHDLREAIRPFYANRNIRMAAGISIILLITGGAYISLPAIKAKERLLRNVRDVRYNANDAIKWMGSHLPDSSIVLVASPEVYGYGQEEDLTSKDDEFKLYAQYTFLQGYIRSYFHALNRYDLSLGYLEDSIKLSQVLDSCRSGGKYYLFLQTGADVDHFHGSIDFQHQLRSRDTLVAAFLKGPYPSEVWKLGP